jgi:hypothetical protein
VAVNGKRVLAGPAPGQFARIDRTWKNGDRIEIEFDIPTTLEAVDPQHTNLLAPVHGPLALFTVGSIPSRIRKRELLAVSQLSPGSTTWQARTSTGNLTLLPFTAIGDEHYRLYLNVEG